MPMIGRVQFHSGGVRSIALQACAVLALFAAFCALAVADEKTRTPAQNRATAQHLAAALPGAGDGWADWRPSIDWRSGATARRRYRSADGDGQFTILYEIGSRGLAYRKELLSDPEAARRLGFEIETVAGFQALVLDQQFKREIRFWVDDRILVHAVGEAPMEAIRAHVERINIDALRAIR